MGMEANIAQLGYCTELLQYFTGTTASTATTKKYSATGINTGWSEDDIVYITGFSNTDSNGYKTIASIASGYITVDEAIGANETGITAVLNQEWRSAWFAVTKFAKLIGSIYCSQAAKLYVDFSVDKSNITYQPNSSGETVSSATRMAFAYETVAPFARFRLLNNGADQTYVYAWFGGRFTS